MKVRECQKAMDRAAKMVGMIRITHHDLRHLFAPNSTRMLTRYGNPGSSYQLAYATNLLSPNWQAGLALLMTNLFEYLIPNQVAPQIYYRSFTPAPYVPHFHRLS